MLSRYTADQLLSLADILSLRVIPTFEKPKFDISLDMTSLYASGFSSPDVTSWLSAETPRHFSASSSLPIAIST